MFSNFGKGESSAFAFADKIKDRLIGMLETSQNRVKLLKAGFTGKEIEKLYIEGNNIEKIITPINIELAEFDLISDNKSIFHEVIA